MRIFLHRFLNTKGRVRCAFGITVTCPFVLCIFLHFFLHWKISSAIIIKYYSYEVIK